MISGTQKAIGCWSKKTKTTLIRNTEMRIRIKTKLSLTTLLLLTVSLRPRLLKKTSVKKVIKETIQPLELILLR